jgi:hypothetical protein
MTSKKTNFLLALAVALTAVLYKLIISKPPPYVLLPAPGTENSTIFVSIPAYRDRLCMPTIREMYEKADNPNRIFVGACEQRPLDSDKETGKRIKRFHEDIIERCRPDPPFAYDANIQVVTISHLAGRGLTYARYLAGSLYRGEDYFLAIDAHTKFQKGWDTDVIAMLESTPNPSKAVITHYPREIEDFEKEPDTIDEIIPVLCTAKYDEDVKMPNFQAHFIPQSDAQRGHKTAFLAGGMYFSKGTVLRDVPLDPGLDFMFVGVELLYAARLWTSGYDLYSPTKNIIFHKYCRKDVPYYHEDLRYNQYDKGNQESLTLTRRVLHFEKPFLDNYKYGLGTVRSLDDYYTFAGIDPVTMKTWTKEKFCPDPLMYKIDLFFYKINRKVRGGGEIVVVAVVVMGVSMLFVLLLLGYLLFS